MTHSVPPIHSARTRRRRRGFSLLEVMVSLGILTVSLVILVETQSSAVVLTLEGERMVTATDLAQHKMTEAMLVLEEDGFQTADVYESGDFDDLGDEILDLELGDDLEDYKWEYAITETDIDQIADIAGAAEGLEGGVGGLFGGGGGEGEGGGDLGGGGGGNPAMDMLGAMGLGGEQITDTLGPYIREVRVRVWWGKDTKVAEEDGTEVVLTSHAINPSGLLTLQQEIPQ